MESKSVKPTSFTIAVDFEGRPDKPIPITAYLFDRAGALLGSAPVENGKAQLSVERVAKGARLLIGPSFDGKREALPSLHALEQMDAFEPQWRFDPQRPVYELPPIPDILWPHWPLCICRVRGRIVKRTVSAGGVVVEAPVCNARVHICEVDRLPFILWRLPDLDIIRIRDDLLDILRQPIPKPKIPIPDPGPLNDIRIASMDVASLRQKTQVRQIVSGSRGDKVAFNPQPDPPVDAPLLAGRFGQSSAFTQLSQPMLSSLLSESVTVVRRALVDNLTIIRPWICRWPWLHHWFYRCDELRVVMTDDYGHFETTIWYPCSGDKPDLYFWVEYSIGGTWTTVHRPPIPCHIWWNYPCNTEVKITVTDPRVPGCGTGTEVLGKQIVVKTIGRQVSMGEINREPSLADPSADLAKAGTVKSGWIDATKESPFGATLEPRVDFGDGLVPANITHYRWSYRTLGSASEADWTVIDAPVSRHYREATPPGAPVVYKSLQIGPAPGVTGYFVEIDPVLPAGGEDWEILDEGFDLASAYLNTEGLAPGKYELKLELFRKVAGVMTRVDLTAEGVGINQIVDPAPLTEGTYVTQPAAHDRLLLDGAGHAVAYRLVLHVDNRQCFGTILPVTVAPGANDTPCGFLEYEPGAAVTIAFRASQPGNYASFDFDVGRVATLLPSASAVGHVDAASVNGFVRADDQFSKTLPVATLFTEALPAGQDPCIRAAFGEALHVYALATDGYGRLSQFDAPRAADPAQVALRAFALTPAD